MAVFEVEKLEDWMLHFALTDLGFLGSVYRTQFL